MPTGTPHDDEFPYASNPSGSSYIRAMIKDGSDPDFQLRIRAERTCAHLYTVCLNCVDSWALDYHLWYDRTIGGRAMAARMATRTPEQRRAVL